MTTQPTILKLDDKTLKLYYDGNAFCELEDRFGCKSFDDFLTLLGKKKVSMKTIITLVWAGALHHQPDITETDVGRAEIGALLGALVVCTKAIYEAMPQTADVPAFTKAKENQKGKKAA